MAPAPFSYDAYNAIFLMPWFVQFPFIFYMHSRDFPVDTYHFLTFNIPLVLHSLEKFTQKVLDTVFHGVDDALNKYVPPLPRVFHTNKSKHCKAHTHTHTHASSADSKLKCEAQLCLISKTLFKTLKLLRSYLSMNLTNVCET